MIDIVYDPKKLKVTVKGHADSAEKGHDLVCSAVSILTYTLAGNMEAMHRASKNLRRPKVKLSEGDSEISIKPVHGAENIARLIFNSVCIGYELLAAQYPQFIHYAVKG